MADRGNIELNFNSLGRSPCREQTGFSSIFLYTQSVGSSVCEILANALERALVGKKPGERGIRWDDPPYLARIIFSEMLLAHGGESALEETTGLGISPYETDNENEIPTVMLALQEIVYAGERYSYRAFIERFKARPTR